ncbi:hypothetical protein C8J57DRAFT_1477259 [Mycena rebaudengoi]|nr:hypothetical protein C8J57DRAFT_1477259 [Mycena rebaudengoi]
MFGRDARAEKYMDRAYVITGRIEPLVFVPEAFEYFMFAVDGQYYDIQPTVDLRRAASTKLEPLPEFDCYDGYHDDTDDEDFDLEGGEVGTGTNLRCKL